MVSPSRGGRSPARGTAFMFIFESRGQGLLGPGSGPPPPHGRSLPVVLSDFGLEQLGGSPPRRLRPPQDPDPPSRGHVRPCDDLLRPRGHVRLSASYVHLGLLRLEQRAPGHPPTVLLLPHAGRWIRGLVHRTILPRIRADAAPPRETLPAVLPPGRRDPGHRPRHHPCERITGDPPWH